MREYFTPFERKLIKDLAEHANTKILPYEFIAKHMNANEKPIRIYDKQRYVYNEKTPDGKQGEILTTKEFIAAIRSGRYSSVYNENAQTKESFFQDNRLQSQVYISDFIKSHIGAFIYVSPMLVELSDNKFKTPEQIRFEEQNKQTKLEDIKQDVKTARTVHPEVIDTRVTKDTLKVDALKPISELMK